MICVVLHLESLVRALVATWTECRDALIKHHAIVAIFTAADATCSRRWWFAVANHRAILCPSLSLNENIYRTKRKKGRCWP